MYELPELPYSYQELEPFIDTHTMGLHYHKHEQNYLNKLNELLQKNNYDYCYSLTELLFKVDEFSDSIKDDLLFNLGGILNHNLYWKSMNPKPSKPVGRFRFYLERKFGSYDNFWKEMKAKALSLKGSGYTFLVLKKDRELEIINVANQDTPLLMGYIPLFNIDMWEHAYYLNYENEKAQYLDNFMKIADFRNASDLFNSLVK